MNHSDLSSDATADFLDLDGPPEFELLLLATVDEQWAPPADASRGGLLLAPGFAGGSALELIASCAGGGLAGVALREPPPGADWTLAAEQAARAAKVRLYWLAAEHSWTEAHQRLAARLSDRDRIADAGGRPDLADLAQTIAALTGGLVTIEDMAARVIAYSSSGDEVDALRRLSILGRSGPEDYLALLRTWGVYDRLAQPEDVVEIDEHPESGVRRRLAVGVFAGQRQLGVIWVQQGAQDFGPHAREALIGAARITAEHLMGTRNSPAAAHPQRLSSLLAGRVEEHVSATRHGSDTPSAVAVIAITGSGQRLGEPAADPAGRRLALRQVSSVLELHAAAFRRDATVEIIDERIYLLLPGLSSAAEARSALTSALRDASRQLAAVITSSTGGAEVAVGAIGPLVARTAEAGVSRAGADLALPFSLSEAGQGPAVTLFDEVRTQLIADVADEAVAARSELALPALERMIHEQPVITLTLLRYLDSGGQVAATASRLGVHVTTVRYRLRRASEASGLDLDDADDRLAAQLILRFAFRAGQIKA